MKIVKRNFSKNFGLFREILHKNDFNLGMRIEKALPKKNPQVLSLLFIQRIGQYMQRNLNLNISYETPRLSPPQESKKPSEDISHEWISAFNTSILTTCTPNPRERSRDLNELMQSPELASLLFAAQHLAHHEDVSKEEATERLIKAFREIDTAWKQVVMARGLKALID